MQILAIAPVASFVLHSSCVVGRCILVVPANVLLLLAAHRRGLGHRGLLLTDLFPWVLCWVLAKVLRRVALLPSLSYSCALYRKANVRFFLQAGFLLAPLYPALHRALLPASLLLWNYFVGVKKPGINLAKPNALGVFLLVKGLITLTISKRVDTY